MGELLPYGLEGRGREGLNVKERLDDIERFFRNYRTEKDGKTLLKDLQEIKREVEKREENFYTKLGVKDFQELNEKIKSIEKKYNAMLPNGIIMQQVRSRFSFVGVAHATNDELAESVEEILNDFVADKEVNEEMFLQTIKEIGGEHGETPTDAFGRYLQKALHTESGKRFITSRGGGKVGLGKMIVKFDTSKDKKKRVTVDMEGVKISTAFRTKLEKDLTAIYDRLNSDKKGKIDVYSMTKEVYREHVNALIHKYVGNLASLGIDTSQFDLNRSIASTTGYLGEVRAAAMLNELAPGSGTRGTGALRTIEKGQEIPIDIVCMANGFQIKNYTLNNNEVSFSNTLSSVGWIQNRLQLKGDAQELLIDLFGIYQYNQPFTRADKKQVKEESLMEYENVYDRIANRDNGLLYELKEVYDSRVPQMMKIADEFAVGGDSMFHSKRLYFNTFFWINKHLVPASWILTKLEKALNDKEKDSVIRTNYDFSKPIKDTKRYAQLGQKHRQEGIGFTPYDMAKKIKTSYEITIDLSEFI